MSTKIEGTLIDIDTTHNAEMIYGDGETLSEKKEKEKKYKENELNEKIINEDS